MKKTLIVSYSALEKEKVQLRKAILRKKQILEELTTKVEELRMDINLIKHEYHVRVGGLILKDNQLDLEILQLKNLQDLMSQGMTYGQAIKSQEDAFYNEILRLQKEQEVIDEEEKALEGMQQVHVETLVAVKEIWKKLIRKFHPDLVTNKEEKNKREEIMKQINTAYTNMDLSSLKRFENDVQVNNIEESNVQSLQEILVDVENMIDRVKEEYALLKESEWYSWKLKKDKTKKDTSDTDEEDIFIELETSLLDDIARKIQILQQLREKTPQQEII